MYARFFGKVRSDVNQCRVPIDGAWETIFEDAITNDFLHLPAKVSLLFTIAKEYHNESKLPPFNGGFLDQPKMFWEIVRLGNNILTQYNELERTQREKYASKK